jgi:hypothetical protein
MKKLSALFLAAFLIGCGGGGSGGGGGSDTPAISNLQLSATSVMEKTGGGTAAVTGRLDFTDSGGNLDHIVVTTYDNNHNQVGSITIPASLPGITAGTLSGTLTFDTSVPGVFTFTILVYDSAGNTSNSLSGTFTIIPDPWQPRSNPLSPGTKITSVVYGGGIFLAGAKDNSILGSADGTTWFIANPGIGKTIRRITYGNGHFVAIAEDPVNDIIIASADNGTTWTTAPQTEGKNTWRDISFGNGIFFVTQENSDSLYASLDNGATWTRVSSALAYSSGMDAPAFGNGKFVASVNGGNTLVSADGISWSLGSPYGVNTRPLVTFDNGVFAIVPLLGDVYVSHDGAITWQNRFTIPTYWWMWDLAAGDGIFVGVGRVDSLSQQGGVLCASYGGDLWVTRTLGSNYLWGIAYGKGTFVAVGDNATIYQSAQGWKP